MSFFAKVGPEGGRELAAKYVIEDAGQAKPGWKLFPCFLRKVWENFEMELFEFFLRWLLKES